MFFILVILIFIILPSTLFYYVEGNWTYLDCVYYTFVSLTTIGFGDLITAQGEQERFGMWIFAYNGFTVVWLIFGLGFISMNNTLLADRIKNISNRLGNFSIIPLFMTIPTHDQSNTEEYEVHEMNILTHTARRVTDPGISFSARAHCSHFKPNLQIARGRSLKIPAVITYDISKDNEGLQIVNEMHKAELIDLRKECAELRMAKQGLQVTNNAAEAELITLREKCMELRKANNGLQITNSVAEAELIALGEKCTELRKAYKSLHITNRAAQSELISLRGKCQLVAQANEGLLIANYEVADELAYQSGKL